MIVKVNNISKNLTDQDFIAIGGQGQIYGQGDLIYKIYYENIIPKEKIKELQVLDRPEIIKPLDLIYSNSNYIGFTMKWIKNTVPLVKLFSNSFYQDNNINSDQITEIIKKIQSTINYIHSKNILIVDGNQFNYLLDEKFENVYFIDVDSYQTKNFPASAILEAIRDQHNPVFNKESDWFSFAVIAFQLYTGIHPYKGSHPDFDRKDLIGRMKKNVSVFNNKVSLPATIRDFNSLPVDYKDWFYDVFEKGKRTPPPDKISKIVSFINVHQDESIFDQKFNLELIFTFKDFINNYIQTENHEIVSSFLEHKINNKFYKKSNRKSEILIFNNLAIEIWIEKEQINFKILNDKNYKIQNTVLKAKSFFIYQNQLFLIQKDKIIFVSPFLNESTKTLFLSFTKFLNILPNSSEIYPGVIYQNTLNKPYFIVPYLNKKNINFGIFNIKELESFKILNIKRHNNCLLILLFKNNEYNKAIIKFDKEYKNYDIKFISDSDMDLHLITLEEKGIGVFTNEEKFYIFSLNSNLDKFNIIESPKLFKYNFKLFLKSGNILFQHSNKLYNLTVKR